MKALFLVVGTVGLVASPAVAAPKKRDIQKPVVVAVEKTEMAAPIEVAAPVADAIAMPELPHDTSSPLVPFPELENKAPIIPAKPVKHAAKTKAPVMKMGKNYILGGREGAAKDIQVQDVERVTLKTLTQAQVASVVQSHMADVQSCWTAVPKQLRVDACTADLKLTISETGAVTDIELGGDVPAAAHKCMTSAISRWTFPTAETTSEVEYGISLRSM